MNIELEKEQDDEQGRFIVVEDDKDVRGVEDGGSLAR
jgi:hypothetical protein